MQNATTPFLSSRQSARPTAQGTLGPAWLLRPTVQIGLILLVGLGLYLPTLHAPFIFDDYSCIVENPAIRSIRFFLDFDQVRALAIDNDIKNNFALRPVAYLTFHLNYLCGGLRETGFHLVNTAIHLLNALLVYLLAAVTLRQAALRAPADEPLPLRRFLPLLVALLFVVHPLQTQAVTYIVQRFASLATCFYLLALLLYIGARTAQSSRSRWFCYGLALAVTLLAMKTKEIAFTLPLVMLLYDSFFLAGEPKERFRAIFPFLLTMTIVPATVAWLARMKSSGASQEVLAQSMDLVNFARVSRWDYLLTQFGVVTTYLRLLLLPFGQNLDHDYRLARSLFEWRIAGSFLLLLTLLVGALFLAVRSFREEHRSNERLIAFGILWFFVTLAVESSIIPIDDLLVEHRVYLPSFGVFLALAVAAATAVRRGLVAQRIVGGGAVLVIVLLAAATVARNDLYRNAIRMMQDVIAKSPERPRARSSLGQVYHDGRQYDAAIAEYARVLRIKPEDANTLINLGCARLAKGEVDEAISQFVRAVVLAPDNYLAHGNLGFAYLHKGMFGEAERELKVSLAINPHFIGRSDLVRLYEKQGRNAEAIEQYEKFLNSYSDAQDAALRLRQIGTGW